CLCLPLHLRRPHSFPTRRSSDLPRSVGASGKLGPDPTKWLLYLHPPRRRGDGVVARTVRLVPLRFILQESRQPLLQRWQGQELIDRKSTRLNSSHVETSYAVFCL